MVDNDESVDVAVEPVNEFGCYLLAVLKVELDVIRHKMSQLDFPIVGASFSQQEFIDGFVVRLCEVFRCPN